MSMNPLIGKIDYGVAVARRLILTGAGRMDAVTLADSAEKWYWEDTQKERRATYGATTKS